MFCEGEPPIRPSKGDDINVSKLIEENKNLKRLLDLVKSHVIYDNELYKEIKEAVKNESYKRTA